MSRGTLDPAVSLSFSPTGLSPSLAGLSRTVWLTIGNHLCSPNPAMHAWRFGLFPFRSPLLWKSIWISPFSFSSSGYLDVSVHRVPPVQLWIHCTVHEGCSCGFPHSDTCGSLDMCSSPQLFAAYRVFHRLSVPRHPPCALLCLTWFGTACIALHAQAWFVFCCPCSRTLSFTAVWLCSRHASCFHSASGYLGCLIRIN